ncbi:hypothetical protein HS088_TW07G00325 [Tripterygium wilfordii]|uniref:Uncharacterized protein n=1 Tax=Tripterygium wilfordii TaxID=458696 RepID=A0A7J7DFB0_TRIWF|nr:hypothetical protein HS088_TW07G00325 [Tripterygium wilfordii]
MPGKSVLGPSLEGGGLVGLVLVVFVMSNYVDMDISQKLQSRFIQISNPDSNNNSSTAQVRQILNTFIQDLEDSDKTDPPLQSIQFPSEPSYLLRLSTKMG